MKKINKKKICIAVTGLNNTDNPGPGIPVIRGIKDSDAFDVRIIGLAYENLEPGIYMHDLVDKTYQIPYPTAGIELLIQRLEYINSIENIDMLIPNFDAELYSFMKSADKLKKMGIIISCSFNFRPYSMACASGSEEDFKLLYR